MTDSLFSRFAKAANYYFSQYAAPINFLASPANVNLKINEKGDTLLIKAAREGNIDEINRLIQAGAHLDLQDNYGNTALISAALKGHTDVVNALIQAFAYLDLKNNHTLRDLRWALRNGCRHKIEALLPTGSDILSIQGQCGDTALITAARNGHTNTVVALIQAGAHLNLEDAYGNTALICTVLNGHTHTANTLIQAGADIMLVNKAGENALILADKYGKDDITFSILNAMTFQQIANTLQAHPKLKNLVNRFKEKENEAAVKSAALDKDDYLLFPSRMCLKWQAAKTVANKYTHPYLVNQAIPEDVMTTVEASRKFFQL